MRRFCEVSCNFNFEFVVLKSFACTWIFFKVINFRYALKMIKARFVITRFYCTGRTNPACQKSMTYAMLKKLLNIELSVIIIRKGLWFEKLT